MRIRSQHAFTLLELLVAVTITLIFSGLMLTVVTHTLNLWQRTQNRFSTSAQATLVLDLLERDLQAAVYRNDGATWLAVDVINAPQALVPHGWLTRSTMKPETGSSLRLLPDLGDGMSPLIANARFGLSGCWLRFITTNVETEGSLPVAVSYQIARRPVSGSILASNPADVCYSLFRSAVSTTGTYTTGNDVLVSGYVSSSVTPASTRNPKTLMNPNNADVLATNVVDFGIWLSARDETTGVSRRIFPADDTDFSHGARTIIPALDGDRFPDVADVMVRILSDRGAALIAEIETGGGRMTRPAAFATDAEWWWGVVELHSRVFVRRIAIRGDSR